MNAAQRSEESPPTPCTAPLLSAHPPRLPRTRDAGYTPLPARSASPQASASSGRVNTSTPKLNTSARKLDTSAPKLDTFLQELDTSAPELNTLVDRREHLRGSAYRPRRTLGRREPTRSPHRHLSPDCNKPTALEQSHAKVGERTLGPKHREPPNTPNHDPPLPARIPLPAPDRC